MSAATTCAASPGEPAAAVAAVACSRDQVLALAVVLRASAADIVELAGATEPATQEPLLRALYLRHDPATHAHLRDDAVRAGLGAQFDAILGDAHAERIRRAREAVRGAVEAASQAIARSRERAERAKLDAADAEFVRIHGAVVSAMEAITKAADAGQSVVDIPMQPGLLDAMRAACPKDWSVHPDTHVPAHMPEKEFFQFGVGYREIRSLRVTILGKDLQPDEGARLRQANRITAARGRAPACDG